MCWMSILRLHACTSLCGVEINIWCGWSCGFTAARLLKIEWGSKAMNTNNTLFGSILYRDWENTRFRSRETLFSLSVFHFWTCTRILCVHAIGRWIHAGNKEEYWWHCTRTFSLITTPIVRWPCMIELNAPLGNHSWWNTLVDGQG